MDIRKSKKYFPLQVGIFLCISCFVWPSFSVFAQEDQQPDTTTSQLDIFDQKKQRIANILDTVFRDDTIYAHVDGKPVTIDVSNELEAIQNLYTKDTFSVSWDLTKYDNDLTEPVFEIDFSQVGHR